MEAKMNPDAEPFEKIKALTHLNLKIFEMIDSLKGFNVGLAAMKLRDATIEIQMGMAKIADKINEKDDNQPE